MNRKIQQSPVVVLTAAMLVALAAFTSTSRAQITLQQITSGLVSYYPLDQLVPGTTNQTPDLVNRRDLTMYLGSMAGYMNGSNYIVAGSHPGMGDSTAVMNLPQSPSPTVLVYQSTGQNPLDGSGDFLPFINQRNATMNFWMKGNVPGGNDQRVMAECANNGDAQAFFSLSTQPASRSNNGLGYFLRENVPVTDPNGVSANQLYDGTYQDPAFNYVWSQSTQYSTNVLFDNNWHMLTTVISSNGDVHLFVDGNYDPGNQSTVTTDNEGNPAICPPLNVTNTYYNTNVYPFGPMTTNGGPGLPYVHWMIPGLNVAGAFTTFGGFDRNGGIAGGPAIQLSDIGYWNRALSQAEIQWLMTNGIWQPVINPGPLKIKSFTPDFYEAGSDDQVTLRWDVTNATSITISGVGDVTALGQAGSTNVTVSSNTVFTLTAANGLVAPLQLTINVKALPGVSPDWHLIQRFDGLFTDTISGINGFGWVGHIGSISFHPDYWNVLTLANGGGTNKVLVPQYGYGVNGLHGALAYGLLNGLTIPPNQSNTLFFRFALKDPGPNASGFLSDLDCGIGLSDKPFIGGPSDVTGSSPGTAPNVGPFISIIRNSGGAFNGGPFDLVAQDYGGSSNINMYSYIASVDPNGLQTNMNYYIWMDIENENTHAVTNPGVSTNTVNEALYSVWLQKQGDPGRTLLFANFHGNRDYVNSYDGPTPWLNKVFVSVGAEEFTNSTPGAYITTNMIAVDDFYLSKNGFQSSIPRLLDIRSITSGSASAAITWDSLGSIYETNTYTVQRKLNLSDPVWITLTNGVPSGGDSTSFTDNTLGSSDTAFYRIVWP